MAWSLHISRDISIHRWKSGSAWPAPLQQDKTCISGQVCNVKDIAGFLLDVTGDSVMVLDTCGHPGRQSPARVTVRAELETGGILHFGSNSAAMLGGTYRLCWCGIGLSEANSTHLSNISECTLASDSKWILERFT